MKITATLLLNLLLFLVNGQSQRVILFEEFTQASCGPCEDMNPALNEMLNSYPDTVVSIKYQTYFPGIDPMNAHNPQQVSDRQNFYNVNGVPYGKLDGGIAFSGIPDQLTNSQILNRSSVSSPFSINTSFTLSAGNDTIFCTAELTASQSVNGTLNAHMVVVERDIYFTSSPGQNDETHFESVMKKMLPSSSGITLPSVWQIGDTIQLNNYWKLANVYDIHQLALVVFIQDNNTKEVLQAGYARPHINNEVDILSASNIPALQCSSNTINPEIKIKNKSATLLNYFTLETFANDSLIQSINVTGAIDPDADTTVVLPSITLVNGTYELKFKVSFPNGMADEIPFNDTLLTFCSLFSNPGQVFFSADFTTPGILPSGSGPVNPDPDLHTWTYNSTGNNNQGSIFVPVFDAEITHIDYYYLPLLDLTNLNPGDLTFDVAYARYNTNSYDELEIQVSTDCGNTWQTVYSKSGAALQTSSPTTAFFIPSAGQWRTESVSLSMFSGMQEVVLRYKAKSMGGNNIYVDNINVNSGLNYLNRIETKFIVYPNPATDYILIDGKESIQSLEIYNHTGQKILNDRNVTGTIFLNEYSAGIYTVRITFRNGSIKSEQLILTTGK